jgi:hypothetical protein
MKGGRPAPLTSPPAAAESEKPRSAAPRRKPNPQERHEFDMLALLVAAPKVGSEYLDCLTREHFTWPILFEVLERLREHPDDPREGLSEEDGGLFNLFARLEAVEHFAPLTSATFDFQWRLLERDRLRRQLRQAEAEGNAVGAVALQKQVGALNDSIASR